jgi:uroporphyrinogen decarboxylase
MTERENYLRAVRFERPEWIPMRYVISGAAWNDYPHEELFDLMEAHPLLFPRFRRPEGRYVPYLADDCKKDVLYTDPFGCVWKTAMDGIRGAVIRHPLEDWEAFERYRMPAWPQIDWEQYKKDIDERRRKGEMVSADLPHGHTFLRLSDLRGYPNLLYDMADEEPRLFRLIEMNDAYNEWFTTHWAACRVDRVGFPDDLGMQAGPMLSPDHFRKYIKPSYRRIMKPVRDAGIPVHMHSDGDIRLLIDDLIDCGVEIINLQDLVNGIDWIVERLAGKICVDLDIDRQSVVTYGTPVEIDSLIRTEVSKIGCKQGGLTMVFDLYPGVPLANVKAVMDAMEKYAFYFNS